MAQLEPTRGGYYLWKFLPSIPAAVLFLILFLFITAAHFWRLFKTKNWFCISIAIGGLCRLLPPFSIVLRLNQKLTRGKVEFIGYAARAAAHDKTGKLMPYVIQNVYILVAPALFAASIYMTLGRVVHAVHGEQYSIIPAKWLTKLFVTGDVASFVIQGGAAGLMVTGSHAKVGQALIILGLVVQVVSFALFGVTAAIFFKRMSALPTRESYTAGVSWKRILVMLFICSALIFVRSIFRVVEYAMGVDGYLLTHEWTLYVFDSLLMWIAMVVFFWQYPSHLRAKVSDSEAQTYYHSHLRVPSEEDHATTKMASSESVWSVARS